MGQNRRQFQKDLNLTRFLLDSSKRWWRLGCMRRSAGSWLSSPVVVGFPVSTVYCGPDSNGAVLMHRYGMNPAQGLLAPSHGGLPLGPVRGLTADRVRLRAWRQFANA